MVNKKQFDVIMFTRRLMNKGKLHYWTFNLGLDLNAS